jgi:hypothetical protein
VSNDKEESNEEITNQSNPLDIFFVPLLKNCHPFLPKRSFARFVSFEGGCP